MGRLGIILIAVVLALGVGVGGTLLLTGDDDTPDRTIAPVAVQSGATAGASPRVAVDDGVPARDAESIARRAAEHVKGQALSVDLDDGRYEVEVQRPDGAIVEVLLDNAQKVITVQQGEGDSVVGD